MISRRQPNPERMSEVENPYWVSFSDIMAGLLVIFILSVVYLVLQLYQVITINRETQEAVKNALSQLTQIERIREEMLQEIQEELSQLNIKVEIVEDSTVLRIPEDQLYFDQGLYSIPENLGTIVGQIGEKISEAINKENRLQYLDTVFIEGHTDSVPMAGSMGNWGLSSYRAISVWNYWTSDPGELSDLLTLVNRKDEAVFSVSGYADTRRANFLEDSDAARRANRRIDIRFTMHTPEALDLQGILERLENASATTGFAEN